MKCNVIFFYIRILTSICKIIIKEDDSDGFFPVMNNVSRIVSSQGEMLCIRINLENFA